VNVFRRRRSSEPAEPVEPVEGTEAAVTAGAREEVAAGTGPWDVTEAPDDDVARLDLGALQVPTLPDVEVRVEADQSGEVSAVLLVHGESGVQLGAFAAPRTEGIWGEVRSEIGQGITAEGGTVTEVEGEFGTELHARVPTPDGVQPVRFVGVNGPRWFLRAVFTGAAATDPDAETVLTESLRNVVVVRGGDPMPVRDALPLRLPREVVEQQAEPAKKGVAAPKRGPEITEVR
jgi:hypothetical protein